MIELRFHPAAYEELRKGSDFYVVRSPQASQQFAVAVDDAINLICKAPERFARVSKRERACRVLGFPYQVVYRHSDQVVHVIAIAHTSRRPGYWRRRR